MRKRHVCPAEHAGMLDNKLRRLIQNPGKILSAYLRPGMKAADIGCGPGFFLPAMAEMVGPSGKVYGYDIQEEMLEKAAGKIKGYHLHENVFLQLCHDDRVGFAEEMDCVLAFYMVHEVPDKAKLLAEVLDILKGGGIFIVIEPLLHVSRKSFDRFVDLAAQKGFRVESGPKVFFSRSAVLRKKE